jgi:hypothetical protein
MSCTTSTNDALFVVSTPTHAWLRWPAIRTIIVTHDAFREALKMQRDAHRRYPFTEE